MKVRRLELFKDKECTIPLSSRIGDRDVVDLGELSVNEKRTIEFFIKNTGETNLVQLNISHNFSDVVIDGIPDRLNSGESARCTLSWNPVDLDNEGVQITDLTIKAKSVGSF